MSHRAPRRAVPVYHSIFVGNISCDVSKAMIFDLFKNFGDIKEVYINTNMNPFTRPSQPSNFTYAFVRFTTKESAERAVKEMYGWPVKGQNLRVEMADSTNPRAGDDPSAPSSQDYINLVKLMEALSDVAHEAEMDPEEASFEPEDLLMELSGAAYPTAFPPICQTTDWSPSPHDFDLEPS